MTKITWIEAEPPTNEDKAVAYWDRIMKPGTLVMTKDKHTHLIGDVNALLGVCNDCKLFDFKDITHYADGLVDIIAITKDQLNRGHKNVTVLMGHR